jgi:hypothetical protein
MLASGLTAESVEQTSYDVLGELCALVRITKRGKKADRQARLLEQLNKGAADS